MVYLFRKNCSANSVNARNYLYFYSYSDQILQPAIQPFLECHLEKIHIHSTPDIFIILACEKIFVKILCLQHNAL